ncbi:MAG: alanine racemase [Kiritimatiellae bacterium]|nr:alanine racemase [Kiritimatiellia bacterium]
MIEKFADSIRKAYASAVGRHRRDLVTPALILDLDLARENLRTILAGLRGLETGLRPHIKGQKCPELARMQVQAGAIGVCAATVWEAIVMSRAGIEDVLIANEVQGKEKMAALAQAARQGRLTVAVDNAENASELDEALRAANSSLEVVIEVDIGMGRGGVRSAAAAVELARHLSRLPNVSFRGLAGYEGHCTLEPDPQVRLRKVKAAIDGMGAAIQALKEAGFECRIVSAGGTGTYAITGADPRITEVQAGSYLFMDRFHGALIPDFKCALTVLGTVVIKQGNAIVLDAGRKSIGIDFVLPAMTDYPEYPARFFAEEHGIFDVDDRCELKLGDTVELVPGYAPTTINLYEAYHVVEKDRVVAIWPIVPRGPMHWGLVAEDAEVGHERECTEKELVRGHAT